MGGWQDGDNTAVSARLRSLELSLGSGVDSALPTTPSFDAATITGLSGATAGLRFVGATRLGPPTSGTFAVGDFVLDHAGSIFVCITAGAPGTWVSPIANAAGESDVRANSLDQMTPPNAPLNMNGQAFTNTRGLWLASQIWAPSGFADRTISSTTPAAVDTTNCTLSFIPQTSQSVVEVTAYVNVNAASGLILFLASHGSTSLLAGSGSVIPANTTFQGMQTVKFYITGQTPGASIQVDLCWQLSSGTTTAAIGASQSYPGPFGVGPFFMEAFSR